MGHLKIRKLKKEYTTWIDKLSEKHKHTFSERYILKEIRPNGITNYYNIMKCSKCDSFQSISEEGNIMGHIFKVEDEKNFEYPILIGYNKNKNYLTFSNIETVKKD